MFLHRDVSFSVQSCVFVWIRNVHADITWPNKVDLWHMTSTWSYRLPDTNNKATQIVLRIKLASASRQPERPPSLFWFVQQSQKERSFIVSQSVQLQSVNLCVPRITHEPVTVMTDTRYFLLVQIRLPTQHLSVSLTMKFTQEVNMVHRDFHTIISGIKMISWCSCQNCRKLLLCIVMVYIWLKLYFC